MLPKTHLRPSAHSAGATEGGDVRLLHLGLSELFKKRRMEEFRLVEDEDEEDEVDEDEDEEEEEDDEDDVDDDTFPYRFWVCLLEADWQSYLCDPHANSDPILYH